MAEIKKIFENNKAWVAERLKESPDYFKTLSEGQDPKILYIGCSDSRVTAEELMGVGPGEAFIHRNIANLVPDTDLSSASVINYAVNHLSVDHVVVCGHYYCGGVKAAMTTQDLGILNPWLRNIRDVFRLHQDELDAIDNEEEKYKRLVELNVLEQCINIIKTPEVQGAYKSRGIKVHGWVFDIHSGELIELDINFDVVINRIMKIYHLDT